MTDNKNKKVWLNRYANQVRGIERLENKRDTLEERITSVRSPTLSGLPRGGEPITIEDLIADKVEIVERILRLKDKARRVRREILDAIADIGDVKLCEVMEGRYILLQSPEDIARGMGYNTRHVWVLLSQGVEAIEIPGLEEFDDPLVSPDP